MLKIGTRVVTNPIVERWSGRAGYCLSGIKGTIIEQEENSINSVGGNGPAFLVKLDRKPEKWWTYQCPSDSWWFDPDELIEE